METSSLGAFRTYDIAKKTLSVEGKNTAGPLKDAKTKGSGLVNAAQDFAQTFDRVEKLTTDMANGQANAHTVVEALANAEMALETAVIIRNRVVEAYQELLRMPV